MLFLARKLLDPKGITNFHNPSLANLYVLSELPPYDLLMHDGYIFKAGQPVNLPVNANCILVFLYRVIQSAVSIFISSLTHVVNI